MENEDEAIDDQETPPVIPRYDSPTFSQHQPPQTQARRLIRPVVGGTMVIENEQTTNRKVLMIRHADGSTQMLRPIADRGPRVVQRLNGQSHNRYSGGLMHRSSQSPTFGQQIVDPFMRRLENVNVPRLVDVPRSSFSQRQNNSSRHLNYMSSSQHHTNAFREFARRTWRNYSRNRYQFDEHNGERPLSRGGYVNEDARARMFQDERRVRSIRDFAGISLRSHGHLLTAPVCKNLLMDPTDSADIRTIKQVLESMISQACRWDKHYGWYRMHLTREKNRRDMVRQNEQQISEHVEYLRKEINKRRSQLETQSEDMVGQLAPWRRTRGRPSNKLMPPVVHLHNSDSNWSLSSDLEFPHFASEDSDWQAFGYLLEGDVAKNGADTPPSAIAMDGPSDEEYDRAQLAPLARWLAADDDDENANDIAVPDLALELDEDSLSARSPSPTVSAFDPPSPQPTLPVSTTTLQPLHIEIPPWRQPQDLPTPELAIVPSFKRPHESADTNDEPISKRLRSNDRRQHQRFLMAAENQVNGSNDTEVWTKPHEVDDSPREGGVLMHIPDPLPRSRGRPRKAEGERRRKEAEVIWMQKMEEGGIDTAKMIDPTQLHCICQMPFDDRKFYVACNTCKQWFHGKCIGISEKRARRLTGFKCHDCRSPQEPDDDEDDEDDGPSMDIIVKTEPEEEGEEIDIYHEGDEQDHAGNSQNYNEIKQELLDEDDDVEDMEDIKILPEESQEEVYCVCKKPYDENKFYVGCDGCEGWFHPHCVGITQHEARRAASYLCPDCRLGRRATSTNDRRSHGAINSDDFDVAHSTTTHEVFLHTLEGVSNSKHSWPFKEPVDIKAVPNYRCIVKNPMDLSTIEAKLNAGKYSSYSQFIADMYLITENARLFNQKGSKIYQAADALDKVIRNQICEAKALQQQ